MDASTKWDSWLSFISAAIVGAVLIAVPAVVYHKQVVYQLEHLNRQSKGNDIRRHRGPSKAPHRRVRSRSSSRDRSSVSLHEVVMVHEKDSQKPQRASKWPEQDHSTDSKPALQVPFGTLSSIPPGLPRVQTQQEVANNHLSPTRRLCSLSNSVLRPNTPKSPSGFDVGGSSDEEDISNDQDEQAFGYEEMHGDSLTSSANMLKKEDGVKPSISPVVLATDHSNGAVERTGNVIGRSHSIPGELHGIHAADPVAADILRKEPEQETFVRLQIGPIEAPSAEEEEVCRMMQECLALRQKYVFRERAAPWDKETITDPSTPKRNPDPFYYEQEPASKHVFQMIDGVVHVYTNEEAEQELFPVFSATEFFTDMHRILKIISLGNVRTLC
eukprot:c15864_g1_i1 orf=2-1156(-)